MFQSFTEFTHAILQAEEENESLFPLKRVLDNELNHFEPQENGPVNACIRVSAITGGKCYFIFFDKCHVIVESVE